MRLAALVAALLAAGPAGAAPRAFDVAPPPAWVEPLGWDAARAAPPDVADGLDHPLVDDQIRVGAGSDVEHYRHVVWRILSTTGVENGSDVKVSFDPSYERLTLHSVVIHRGARRIDALDPGAVKVIQQEEDLDRRLYDGRLTAVLFLRGVRAGDAVEIAYTRRGANPVFGGRYAENLSLGWRAPIGRLAIRLLVPDGRVISARTHGIALEPAVARRGGATERRWERAPAPAVVHENDVPPGVDDEPWLQLSEWRDWSEVSTWAAALQPSEPSAAMEPELARWRGLAGEERILAAVRFVQDEIRYLGMELGASSHRPHPPAETFERRFGDCKDKALLLVTLLRALGVEAEAALVATDVRAAVERHLPSPIEFDHAVVRVRSGGSWRWVDPTIALERGPLASSGALPYERALPLRAGATLVAIGDPAPRRTAVTSTIRVPSFGVPATLEIRTRSEGGAATRVRQELASKPLRDVARTWLDFYARLYPGLRADGAPEVKDDAATGTIEVVERYVLAPVHEHDDLVVRAAEVANALRDPDSVLRKQPLEVDHPVEIRETIRVVLPGTPDLEGDDEILDTAATSFRRQVRVDGEAIVTDVSYRTTSDRVAPEAVPSFAKSIREMRGDAGARLPLAVSGRAPGGGDPSAAAYARTFGGLGLFGAVLLGVWWVADGGASRLRLRLRRRAFARRFVQGAGDSPQTALAVATAGELEQAVARARCACGAPLAAAGPRGAIRFGGKELAVVPLACPRCGAVRPLYAAPPG